MEAKDTILTEEQMRYMFCGKKGDFSDRKVEVTLNLPEQLPYLLEQAEISFGAGRQAGIKEVVEWVEKESHFGIPKTLTAQSQKDWQVKKEKWGL